MEHQEEKATNHNAATRQNTQNFKTKLEHNEPLSYWGWVFTFKKSILFKHYGKSLAQYKMKMDSGESERTMN